MWNCYEHIFDTCKSCQLSQANHSLLCRCHRIAPEVLFKSVMCLRSCDLSDMQSRVDFRPHETNENLAPVVSCHFTCVYMVYA